MARRALRPDPYRDWDKINPYVSWALGPGRSYYFAAGQQEAGKEVMPLLLRLKGKAAKRFLEGAFITDKERVEPWRAAFRVLCRRERVGDGAVEHDARHRRRHTQNARKSWA